MDLSTVATFRRATTRDDLRLAPGETLLGGGTWLFSTPQPATTGLVDLTTLAWAPWETEHLPPGVALRVAATCTVEQVVAAPWPAALTPFVRACADAFLMSFKIQGQATVGGNLCLALPAGAMISLFAALEADVVIWTPDGGERRTPVTAFVTGAETTALAPGEVVRAVDVPRAVLSSRFAFRKTALTSVGRSSSVVIGRTTPAGVVLTITAATTRPIALMASAGEVPALTDLPWYADPHGPADWRAAVTEVLVHEVLSELDGPS